MVQRRQPMVARFMIVSLHSRSSAVRRALSTPAAYRPASSTWPPVCSRFVAGECLLDQLRIPIPRLPAARARCRPAVCLGRRSAPALPRVPDRIERDHQSIRNDETRISAVATGRFSPCLRGRYPSPPVRRKRSTASTELAQQPIVDPRDSLPVNAEDSVSSRPPQSGSGKVIPVGKQKFGC